MMESIENLVHDSEYTAVGAFTLLESCRMLGVQRIVAASTGAAVAGRPAVDARADHGAAPLAVPGGLATDLLVVRGNHEELCRQG
jgi:hypothetical protein